MSSQLQLKPLFKHKAFFLNEDGSEAYIGDLRTFSDSQKLQIQGDISVKLAERSFFDGVEKISETFILGVKKTEEHSRKLVELIHYIDLRPHRVIVIKLKRDNRKGIASACIPSDLVSTGCSHGIRVTMVPSESATSAAISTTSAVSAGSSGISSALTSLSVPKNSDCPNYDPSLLYNSQKLQSSSQTSNRSNISDNNLIPISYNSSSVTNNAANNTTIYKIEPTESDVMKKKTRIVNFDVPQVRSFSNLDPPAAVSAQDQAAAQYNKLNRRTATRHLSYIYHLRELDNCIKTSVVCLATQHVSSRRQSLTNPSTGLSVLELAMGKGGDFQKWIDAGLTRYVGADIAENSLKDFVDNRLLDLVTPLHERRPFSEESRAKVKLLVVADLAAHSLSLRNDDKDETTMLQCFDWRDGWHTRPSGSILTKNNNNSEKKEDETQFDVVSCQFAMHYMCRAQSNFSFFLKQLSFHLNPMTGVFVATTVDCRVLAQYLKVVLFGSEQEMKHFSLRVDQLPVSTFNSFENQIIENNNNNNNKIRFSIVHRDLLVETVLLTLTFTMSNAKRLLQLYDTTCDTDNEDDGFGLEYSFTLFDNSRENNNNNANNNDDEGEVAVDAPEWVVPLKPSFLELLHRHNLTLHQATNFQRYFSEECVSNIASNDVKKRLKQVRNAFPAQGMSDAEWALARLYLVCVVTPEIQRDTIQTPPQTFTRDYWQREAKRLFFSDTQEMSSGVTGISHSQHMNNNNNNSMSTNSNNIVIKKERPTSPPPATHPVSLLTSCVLDTATLSLPQSNLVKQRVLDHLLCVATQSPETFFASPLTSPPVSPRVSISTLSAPPSDAILCANYYNQNNNGNNDKKSRWLCVPPITETHVSQLLTARQNNQNNNDHNMMNVDEEDDDFILAVYERAISIAGGQDKYDDLTEAEVETVQMAAKEQILREKCQN